MKTIGAGALVMLACVLSVATSASTPAGGSEADIAEETKRRAKEIAGFEALMALETKAADAWSYDELYEKITPEVQACLKYTPMQRYAGDLVETSHGRVSIGDLAQRCDQLFEEKLGAVEVTNCVASKVWIKWVGLSGGAWSEPSFSKPMGERQFARSCSDDDVDEANDELAPLLDGIRGVCTDGPVKFITLDKKFPAPTVVNRPNMAPERQWTAWCYRERTSAAKKLTLSNRSWHPKGKNYGPK